jgi:hypothetical protein
LVHIAQGLALGSYNPGLFTSVVLFIPLSVLYYGLALREGTADRSMVAASLLWGAFGHVVLIGGLVLVYVQGRLPQFAYHVLLVAYSLTPFLFFRSRRP